MAHRGQNVGSNTVQIWNGTRWISFDALSFQSSALTVANSLWRNSAGDNSFGHTIATDRRESLSHGYLAGGPANPVLSTHRFFAQVVGQGGGVDPQTFTLPTDVLGVALTPSDTPGNVLVAEFLVAMTHSNGSVVIAERYVAAWPVGGPGGPNVSAVGGITNVSLSVTVSTGSTAPFTITVDYAAFPGDDVRYMLDVEYKVLGVRP